MGLLLGAAIAVLLVFAVAHDRTARVEFASRHSVTVAASADRLLKYELRNLERALAGIAADGDDYFRDVPERAPELMSKSIAGVLARHSELASIVLFDDNGRPLTRDAADPAMARWLKGLETGATGLRFGPLQRDAAHGWRLPLAERAGSRGWVVAQLYLTEFDHMISGLDTGQRGVVGVLDDSGTILARSRDADRYVGKTVEIPAAADFQSGRITQRLTSPVDGIKRVATFSRSSGYPLMVVAGIGMRETLAPWYLYACTAAGLFLLYWIGLDYLVRRLAGAESASHAMLKALHESAGRLREAQLAGRTGTWQLVDGDDQVEASEHMARLFGLGDGAGVIQLPQFFERIHEGDRDNVARAFADALASGEPFFAEYRVCLPGGEMHWLSGRGDTVVDADGRTRMAGTVVDISERMAAQARVEQAEQQFRQTFERNPLPFWVFDVETLAFVAVNEAAIRSYGWSREEFLAMDILDIRSAEEAGRLREVMEGDGLEAGDSDIWLHQTRDGRQLEVRTQSADIDFAGRRARLVLAEDVSERIAYERDLAFRASHDVATGLLTLPAMMESLDAMQTSMQKKGPAASNGYAIAYVQLRDLELIAPTLGRRAGEEILATAARRFGWLGETFGFAAYLPSETFVLAAIDPSQRDEMLTGLTRALAATIEGRDMRHHLEAWIGLATFPADGQHAEQVVGNAALAALQARKEGVPHAVFDVVMAEEASERLALAGRVREALQRREFELFFQPIRHVSDGGVTTLEALIRWRQADGSYVPPAQFIPLCEESGLIVPLGSWVLEEAARMHGVLAQHGLQHVSIAVNVSAAQFHGNDLPGELRRLSTQYQLPRGALHIELTESAVLKRPNTAMDTLQQLRDDGVCISLDDFGTGFSSMSYLKDLPLDYLKIDRAFVTGVDRDERSAAICRALIALGHSVGLKIIAEGVEEAGQFEWLRMHGCDQVQGYYFGRPAPLEDVLAHQFTRF